MELNRNIGISAHIDAGKTTTTERILYYTGVNHKLGEVHDGEATMDWMKQEQERGITITSAATTVFWKKFNENLNYKINIIDTPGHVDFTIEVERCMRVIDSVCMVYCAVSGVQSQSETVWKQSNNYNISKLIFVNKMDRDGADYFNVYNQIKNILKANPVPIYIPYFVNNNFIGLIDLLKYKIILWDDDSNGINYNYDNIPDFILNEANKWRDNIINISTKNNDLLTEKYLNNSLDNNDIINSLRNKTISCDIQPMICGSAFKNKGIQCLLDSIVDFLPSPLDLKFINGFDLNGNSIYRNISIDEKFCAFAFKVVNDSFMGQLIFFRIYSGVLNVGDYIYNSNKKKKEKLVRILQIHANNRIDLKRITAGNIAAAVGLKTFYTGDTLCDPENPIILEKFNFPEPVISFSLEVKNKNENEKIFNILNKFSKEDPSFKFFLDKDSNQLIISGMGELHLEIIIDRIKTEYNIDLIIGKPKVSYKETIRKNIKNIEGKYIKQSGGRGQYGHVVIDIEPNLRNSGFKFIDKIKSGVIPKEYIPVIEKSIIETSKSGVLLGYPVLDVIVYLVFGSFHDVDSSENAFKIAASLAFKEALKKAESFLLEPLMNLDIETPNEYTGIIISDISSKRGTVIDIIDNNFIDLKNIKSEVPLSELFGYSTSLRSLTQGRASFSMVFKSYVEVPKNIFNNLISK